MLDGGKVSPKKKLPAFCLYKYVESLARKGEAPKVAGPGEIRNDLQ